MTPADLLHLLEQEPNGLYGEPIEAPLIAGRKVMISGDTHEWQVAGLTSDPMTVQLCHPESNGQQGIPIKSVTPEEVVAISFGGRYHACKYYGSSLGRPCYCGVGHPMYEGWDHRAMSSDEFEYYQKYGIGKIPGGVDVILWHELKPGDQIYTRLLGSRPLVRYVVTGHRRFQNNSGGCWTDMLEVDGPDGHAYEIGQYGAGASGAVRIRHDGELHDVSWKDGYFIVKHTVPSDPRKAVAGPDRATPQSEARKWHRTIFGA